MDGFLDGHVQNVWELGEEIRMRIIAGMGDAFELSATNPAGMVALVEAVEVYERAAEGGRAFVAATQRDMSRVYYFTPSGDFGSANHIEASICATFH